MGRGSGSRGGPVTPLPPETPLGLKQTYQIPSRSERAGREGLGHFRLVGRLPPQPPGPALAPEPGGACPAGLARAHGAAGSSPLGAESGSRASCPQIRRLRAAGDSFPLMGSSGAVLGRVSARACAPAAGPGLHRAPALPLAWLWEEEVPRALPPSPCRLPSQALRSHDSSTKPLYVSVGHRTSLETAVRLTRSCCRFRVPEPVRQVGGPLPRAPGVLSLQPFLGPRASRLRCAERPPGGSTARGRGLSPR